MQTIKQWKHCLHLDYYLDYYYYQRDRDIRGSYISLVKEIDKIGCVAIFMNQEKQKEFFYIFYITFIKFFTLFLLFYILNSI